MGALLNAYALGLYNVAYNPTTMPNTLLLGVHQPALSSAGSRLQDERQRLGSAYLQIRAETFVLLFLPRVVLALVSNALAYLLRGTIRQCRLRLTTLVVWRYLTTMQKTQAMIDDQVSGFEHYCKPTRHGEFLKAVRDIVRRAAPCKAIEGDYLKLGSRYFSINLGRMLSAHFIRQWFKLPDLCRFVGIDLIWESMRDAVPMPKLRRLPKLEQLFSAKERGRLLASGFKRNMDTMGDVITIGPPSSTMQADIAHATKKFTGRAKVRNVILSKTARRRIAP